MREVGLRSAGVFGNMKALWGCPRTRDVQLALGCFTWWRISLLFSIRPERSPIGQEISGCFFPGREILPLGGDFVIRTQCALEKFCSRKKKKNPCLSSEWLQLFSSH